MKSTLDRYKYVLLVIVLAGGAVLSYLFESNAYGVNRQFGFPLDDPWIHLQFAKNLHDYGSFSYFKNEMVTAGSTSPLYTILLAIGFFVTSNEMVLSYVLGVGFLLGAAFFIFKITVQASEADWAPAFQHFPQGRQAGAHHEPPKGENLHRAQVGPILVGAGSALMLLTEWRMQCGALSGMETTLFICCLLAAYYFYQSKQSIGLGITAGLLLWARPEAIVFLIALGLDIVYHALWVPRPRAKKKTDVQPDGLFEWLKPALIILGVFVAAYALFNLMLSGSVFPNTYAAKIKYYANLNKKLFAEDVFHFLTDGDMIVLAVLAAFGIISILVKLWKRKPQDSLAALLWSIGLFLAYYMKLPFLYQQGRYLMPMLPFVILLGIEGVQFIFSPDQKLFGILRKRWQVVLAQGVVLLLVIVLFVMGSWNRRTEYAEYCKYISDRQVRTAKWLRDNTPENAVIATHDIGAIAFYSGRKIVDMVGLVSPEMIERIGSLDKLQQFLIDKKVTYIAVLRNWFEVVNQPSLFTTNEREPEIMEVFKFDPQRIHFTPQDVSHATTAGAQYLYQGQYNVAGQMLQRALSADPLNSKAHHYMGSLFLAVGRVDDARREFHEALRLDPELLESQVGLAELAARENKPAEAVAQLETIAQRNPYYPIVFRALADVYHAFKLDSVKAAGYMDRFRALMSAHVQ